MILALKFAGQQLESAVDVDKRDPSLKLNEAEENQTRKYTSALRKLRATSTTEQTL